MIKQAVAGLIPLIAVRSDDLIHIEFVLSNMFPDYNLCKLGGVEHEEDGPPLYYAVDKPNSSLTNLYEDAEQNEYSVIFINPDPDPRMMDCGELLPDKNTIHNMLMGEIPKRILTQTVEYLSGLSVQDIKKTLSLATVYFDKLDAESIRKTKEMLFIKQVGITKVDTATEFYSDAGGNGLYDWAERNRAYMHKQVDHRLVPKGVLLHGEPGTGKTEFAKYLGREWGLPLFLLDVNAMLSKWQGEAEHHLNDALETLDKESPCIVLFDEVEKLFLSDSENDTSQRLLSKLLWWMQIKTSKVFVVMTCNNMEVLPTELYRAGRIDKPIEMKGLPIKLINDYIQRLLESFGAGKLTQKCIKNISARLNQPKKQGVVSYWEDKDHIPQATLSQWVIEYLQSQQFGL